MAQWTVTSGDDVLTIGTTLDNRVTMRINDGDTIILTPELCEDTRFKIGSALASLPFGRPS